MKYSSGLDDGLVLTVRFAYTRTGSIFTATSQTDGVFVDDVTVTGTQNNFTVPSTAPRQFFPWIITQSL